MEGTQQYNELFNKDWDIHSHLVDFFEFLEAQTNEA